MEKGLENLAESSTGEEGVGETSTIVVTKKGAYKKGGALDPNRHRDNARKAAAQDTDIFKLQRALVTNAQVEPNHEMILAYNESKTWQGEFQMPKNTVNEIFGQKMKVYMVATADKEGKLQPITMISDQPW